MSDNPTTYLFGRELNTGVYDRQRILIETPAITRSGTTTMRIAHETYGSDHVTIDGNVVLTMDETRELALKLLDMSLSSDSIAEIVDACLRKLNERAERLGDSDNISRVCDAWDEIREDYPR